MGVSCVSCVRDHNYSQCRQNQARPPHQAAAVEQARRAGQRGAFWKVAVNVMADVVAITVWVWAPPSDHDTKL
jgi:hypothetical protein